MINVKLLSAAASLGRTLAIAEFDRQPKRTKDAYLKKGHNDSNVSDRRFATQGPT